MQARRASEDWVKVHAAMEVDDLVVLSYSLTDLNMHDRRGLSNIWDRLPSKVTPIRSLADSVYHNESNLGLALKLRAADLM